MHFDFLRASLFEIKLIFWKTWQFSCCRSKFKILIEMILLQFKMSLGYLPIRWSGPDWKYKEFTIPKCKQTHDPYLVFGWTSLVRKISKLSMSKVKQQIREPHAFTSRDNTSYVQPLQSGRYTKRVTGLDLNNWTTSDLFPPFKRTALMADRGRCFTAKARMEKKALFQCHDERIKMKYSGCSLNSVENIHFAEIRELRKRMHRRILNFF